MNLGDVRQAVVELGFDKALDSEQGFLFALNRAILEINDIQPKLANYKITHYPLENVLDQDFEPIKKRLDDIVFETPSAKAYYFECDGIGIATIEHYLGGEWEELETITLSSNRTFKAYKGLITATGDNIRLTFSGDFSYSIKNVAMYNELYSSDVADIPPYQPYSRYDIKELTKEGDIVKFMEFDNLVIQEGNKLKDRLYYEDKDHFIENNCIILLKYFDEGEFTIWYKAYPDTVSYVEPSDDDEIDLPQDLTILLPELIASYIFLDGDNADQAQYYYELYKIKARDIKERKATANATFSYKNKGWA